jgi:hypothetical protein
MITNRFYTFALCAIFTLGMQAQNKKPQKPATQVASEQKVPELNLETIISMTDTAAYAAIKKLDEQISRKEQQIEKVRAEQMKPSGDLSLESREEMLLRNDKELYEIYAEREQLILRKKELRKKSLSQTLKTQDE